MFRIDGPGATVDGRFRVDPLPATRVTFEWLNALQDELAGLITHEDGGDTALVKADSTQVRIAVQTMISRLLAQYDAAASLYFDQIEKIISDETGGDVAYDADVPEQLLDAVLTMINRGAALPGTPVLEIPGYTFNQDGTREAWATGTAAGNGSTTINWPAGVDFTQVFVAFSSGGAAAANAQDNNPVAISWDATGCTVYNAVDSSVAVTVWGKGK